MNDRLKDFGIKEIPFEAAGTGFSRFTNKWLPERWEERIRDILDKIKNSSGTKSMAIVGEYGTGKTYLLKWIQEKYFREKEEKENWGIRTFYFDNPGVQFYDIANSLLADQIGREEFAKGLYELVNGYTKFIQLTQKFEMLFKYDIPFYKWSEHIKKLKRKHDAEFVISDLLRNELKLTNNEEIATKIATILTEYYEKPYFDYRDFVAGKKSIVAEEKEGEFFTTLMRLIKIIYNINEIAFLIDEFEEIALQKRLTRKAAAQYLYTMRRLIDLSEHKGENFWIILAMIPEAAEFTKESETGLWERFTNEGEYEINFQNLSLDEREAEELVKVRLESVRINDDLKESIFPFPENLIENLDNTTYSTPRRLVKFCFFAIAEALEDTDVKIPFEIDFLKAVEEKVFKKE